MTPAEFEALLARRGVKTAVVTDAPPLPAPRPPRPRVACGSCRHGRPSAVAWAGWECEIEQAGTCWPHAPRPALFERGEEVKTNA